MNQVISKNETVSERDIEMLKALAHPVRLKIVKELMKRGKCNVKELTNLLHLPQSSISQCLNKLKNAKIVTYERFGTEVVYYMKNPKVVSLMGVLFSR